MPDFDPDAYLAEKGVATVAAPTGFDPDAYLKEKTTAHGALDIANVGASRVSPSPEIYLQRQKEEIRIRNADRKKREDFVASNAQKGIPLDVDSGLPATIRARLSLEGNPEKQVDLLSKQPGILAARKGTDNRIIATIDDGAGGKKDVLLHPLNRQVTLGDVAGEAAPIAKGAIALGTAAATGGLSALAQAGAMGAAMGGTQLAQEVGSRVAGGQAVDVPDVLKDSVKEAALNAAAPLVGAGASKLASGAQNLLTGSAGALEKAVPAAAERLGVTTLPSMDTGSKVLARAENAAGLKPQNAVLAGGIKAAEDRQLSLSGGAGVPTEEQVASKVQPLAQNAADAAEAGVTGAKNTAATAAQKQIQATLDSGLIPGNLPQSQAGSYLRSKLEAFAQGVKDEANKNYPAFYEKAAEKGVTLDAKPVRDLVEQIAKEDPSGAAELLSPSIKQVKSVESRLNPLAQEPTETGILDAKGRPTLSKPEQQPPLGFQEAINLRAIVRKKLNATMDPLGDPVKRYYSKLDDALTQTIKNGIDSDKSGELAKLYDKARASYSEGAQALEQGRLPKLFADAGDPGHVPDEKLVPSLFTGAGNLDGLRAWKSVLDPKDYQLLLRQGVNHLIDSSPGTGGYVDAEAFLGKISKLSPEVQAEVLGPLAKPIAQNARLLAAARGAKIDPAELADALASAPGAAPRLLEQAFAREKAFDLQYNNQVAKALRGGTLGPNTLGNVDKFTSDWLAQAGTADVKQALTQIQAASPETAELVRQRTLQNILDQSRAAPELGQISTGGNPAIDASKLVKFTSGVNRDKYQAVLGRDGIQFLDDLATISEANAKRIAHGEGKPLTIEGDAERTGAILGGNSLSLAREAGRGALNLILAGPGNLIRNPAVSQYLKTGDLPALNRGLRTLLVSAPSETEQARQIQKDRSTVLSGRN